MMSFNSGTTSAISVRSGPAPPEGRSRQTRSSASCLASSGLDKILKGLRQSGIRDVTPVLIEFAGGEQSALLNKHLVQLVHDRGFADARISGHKHQFWPTQRRDPVEGCEQCVNFALSTIQLFGNHQPVWKILFAKREFVDVALHLPLVKATPKVTLQARRGLISLLGSFGQ